MSAKRIVPRHRIRDRIFTIRQVREERRKFRQLHDVRAEELSDLGFREFIHMDWLRLEFPNRASVHSVESN